MPSVSPSLRDALLGSASMLGVLELTISWSELGECSRPIHIWLLLAILTLVSLRLVDSFIERRGDALWCCDLFNHRTGRKLVVPLGILYGYYVVWVMLGTCWFLESQAEEQCLLHHTLHFWYYFTWLWYCYFWMTVYTCAIMISSLNLADAYSPAANFDYFAPNLAVPLISHSGLSSEAIESILERSVLDEECSEICSICIEAFQKRETVRVLSCEHVFHSNCIDPWLENHTYCPNCKEDQRQPVNAFEDN